MAGHCLSPTVLRGGLANPQEGLLFSQLSGMPAHLLKGQRYRAVVQRDTALLVTSAPLQSHPSYSSCVMLAQCDRLLLSSILLPRGPRCLQSREGDNSTHTGAHVECELLTGLFRELVCWALQMEHTGKQNAPSPGLS